MLPYINAFISYMKEVTMLMLGVFTFYLKQLFRRFAVQVFTSGGGVWETGYFKCLDWCTFASQRKGLKEFKFPHFGHLVELPYGYRACGYVPLPAFTSHYKTVGAHHANLAMSVMVISILNNLGIRCVLKGQAVFHPRQSVWVEFGIIHQLHPFFC